MPRSETQKLKLIKLIEIFMKKTDENHGLSMSEIIEQLSREGISAERKSIYTDIETLGEMGFAVEKISGKPPKYWMQTRIFELAELKMLVDAVQSSKFITAERSKNIIDKLKKFASENDAEELQRTVYVEGRAKTVNKATIYTIDSLHYAINHNYQIEYQYFDYDAEKKKVLRHGGKVYTVSPLALKWSEENYYLIAFDEEKKENRNYRVDKMQNVKITEIARSKEALLQKAKLKNYTQELFGMFGGVEIAVTLECDESLAQSIIDRFGLGTRFIKTKKGFKVTVRVVESPTFYAWVLGFGSKMKIVSPESVKNNFVKELKATADNYN